MAELVIGNISVFIVASTVIIIVIGEILVVRLLVEFEVKLVELGLRLSKVVRRTARFRWRQGFATL